jgi:hypothetical protein
MRHACRGLPRRSLEKLTTPLPLEKNLEETHSYNIKSKLTVEDRQLSYQKLPEIQ